MSYFVTGGSGFIGRFLIARLLERGGTVHVLMREASREKFESLQDDLKADDSKLVPVWGDITQPGLVSAADAARLAGRIDHVFHVAAVYDMNMDDATGIRVNLEGTRNVVAFTNTLGGKVRFHHVSSIVVAGDNFDGVFSEQMFAEGQSLHHPYFRTKFESEKIVREECLGPWRVYRPGAVVGSSADGAMDKVDGPYYFFKTIQRIRDRMPRWLPLLGVEGGRVPVVPVDYVAAAIDAIAHKEGLDGKAFHLLQTPEPTVGDFLAVMLRAAHGPKVAARLKIPSVKSRLPDRVRAAVMRLASGRLAKEISKAIGMPLSLLAMVNNQTIYDDRQARAALKGSGIACPKLETYAEKLWRYWELFLDRGITLPRSAAEKLRGKVVLITGASSGIGFATARKLGAAGARVCLVARGVDKLAEAKAVIEAHGGKASVYPCDLNDLDAIEAMAKRVLADHDHVDVLINNAGRSIRRAIMESLDRFHDLQRTMQLNYFGCAKLIHALLPSMVARRRGHIINISSGGILANAPRFSAYIASKAALDTYTRVLGIELRSDNIETSTMYMPLVRTPMISPTKLYDFVPAWTPDEAADLILETIVKRPRRVKVGPPAVLEMLYTVQPELVEALASRAFHMFPSSAASRGEKQPEPTSGAIALATVVRGTQW
jgi:NAD(P)-dependent dehydrogenase (short-subunit alcohol dehydrogenase family)